MSIFFGFIIFIIGLLFGSFLNVLIDRLPNNKSILGRSYCEKCKKTLVWKDLIPVLSFVYLRGKCRYCSSKLSIQYPAIEIITGVLFVFTVFQFPPLHQGFAGQAITNLSTNYLMSSIYYLIIVSSVIVVFFADLKYGIIPDKVLITGIIASSIFLFINNQQLIINHLLSAVGSFAFFLFIFLITKGRGMGFGDVKFAFLIGLVLGFPGVVYSLYLTFLTGGVLAIILILWKKKKLKSKIPFGPIMTVNFLITFFFQAQLSGLFVKLLG